MSVSTMTILLVEDNPRDEELALLALEDSRVANDVVVVHDGVQALDYLFGSGSFDSRSPAEQPQLVLLDLKLPKLNGLEVLERIRADPRTELIPVVILTSSDEESDLVRSYKLRVNSYIRKPVDFAQFTEAIRQLGLYWLVLNTVPPAGPRMPRDTDSQ
jgi:two-component system, response regulator